MDVDFTWNGKTYKGELRPVSGGGTIYHLLVKNFYQGQLVRTATGWQFSTQKQGYITDLATLFGKIIEAEVVD